MHIVSGLIQPRGNPTPEGRMRGVARLAGWKSPPAIRVIAVPLNAAEREIGNACCALGKPVGHRTRGLVGKHALIQVGVPCRLALAYL